MQVPVEIEVDGGKVSVQRNEAEGVTAVFIHDETYAVQAEDQAKALRDVVNWLRWKHYKVSPIDSSDDGLIDIYWVWNGANRDLGFPTNEMAENYAQGKSAESGEEWEVEKTRWTEAQFRNWELSGSLSRTYLCE